MESIFTLCSCCLCSAKRSKMSVKLFCGLLVVLLVSQLVMSDDDDDEIVLVFYIRILVILYRVAKNGTVFLYALTSSNINRFS